VVADVSPVRDRPERTHGQSRRLVDSAYGTARARWLGIHLQTTVRHLMHWVHFYPFSPVGDHGGTLRLRTAELACGSLGEQQTFWFDHSTGCWRDDPASSAHASDTSRPGLKRRIFPSTLYESGRVAVRAFRETDWSTRLPSNANAIFHTTYLGPLLTDVRPAWLDKAAIDVYDLVWRAHLIDAGLGYGLVRGTRLTYSHLVKQREMRAISHADAVAVAGYEDWCHVRLTSAPSAWCPTGMIPLPRPPRAAHDPPVVGFLGNFAHQPTIDSARYLLTCPAARAGDIRIVLGGWESLRFAQEFSGRAEILGPVSNPADLWHQVDCAVIPVQSGAGMKCKISEALLAGCPVITTSLGAEGFPSPVRQLMHVVKTLDEVSDDLCRRINKPDLTSAALGDLTREGAVRIYAELLSSVA
jgi:Glycosyl transferases group 1